MAEMDDHPELTPLADFLHRAIDQSGKKQRQLADEMGFKSANMLAMLKHDAAKFPFGKIIPAAIALKVDVAHLLRLVLEQYWPRRLHVIESILGLVVSSHEKKLILSIRRLTDNTDPAFPEKGVVALVRGLDLH